MVFPSIEAFAIGYCCRGVMAARTKKGMKVRRGPWRCSKMFFSLFWGVGMGVIVTSKIEWTWGVGGAEGRALALLFSVGRMRWERARLLSQELEQRRHHRHQSRRLPC